MRRALIMLVLAVDILFGTAYVLQVSPAEPLLGAVGAVVMLGLAAWSVVLLRRPQAS